MSIEEVYKKLELLRIEKGRITEAFRLEEIDDEFHDIELNRINEEITKLQNFISSPNQDEDLL